MSILIHTCFFYAVRMRPYICYVNRSSTVRWFLRQLARKTVVRQAQKKLLTQLVQYSVGIRDHLASPAVFSRFKELKGIFMILSFETCTCTWNLHIFSIWSIYILTICINFPDFNPWMGKIYSFNYKGYFRGTLLLLCLPYFMSKTVISTIYINCSGAHIK